jgi:hypothetical protein
MDEYLFLLEVYRVEAVKPPGSFRPLPEARINRRWIPMQ